MDKKKLAFVVIASGPCGQQPDGSYSNWHLHLALPTSTSEEAVCSGCNMQGPDLAGVQVGSIVEVAIYDPPDTAADPAQKKR